MKPCLVSTWGAPQKYLHAFMDTARRNGLEPVNADPDDWPGDWSVREWFRKSQAQARFVRENADKYTHFLFTDSYDIVFTAGWAEILIKFAAIGSPIVFGAESYCWPDINQAGLYPASPHRCRYLNAGMWMATVEAAIPFTEELAAIAAKREKCDQGIVADMFLSRRHPIALDTECSLLFCMNLDSPQFLDMTGIRPRTIDTDQHPVMFHGNGNASLLGICAKIGP
jgi:lysyl hydroxylase/galactosyltransferase/glucosyltransferase